MYHAAVSWSCGSKENLQAPCINCPLDFKVIDYEPAWSPDGKYIAYVHGDTIIGKTGIYLISSDGTDSRLWHAAITAEKPTWSPDGQYLAFSAGGQIWKKKFNGDSLSRVTFEGRNFSPSWSPDGKSIGFQ